MIGALLSSIVLAATATTAPPLPAGYAPLADDLQIIVVGVPEAWTDIDTTPGLNPDGTLRPYLAASTDQDAFFSSFDAPGLLYVALPYTEDLVTVFSEFGLQSGCEQMEAKTYDDPVFVGVIQIGANCGPSGMNWTMVVANPTTVPGTFTALLQVQSTEPAEIQNVLLTFNHTLDAGATDLGPAVTTIPGISTTVA